jgi:hypothetical protein
MNISWDSIQGIKWKSNSNGRFTNYGNIIEIYWRYWRNKATNLTSPTNT